MMEYNATNPLRVCTTFSGYDSQCLALDRIKEMHPGFEYDLVAWCEIDPNAIKAHNLIYPQWKDRNLGDITQVDWDAVPDFDFFTFSSPCQDFSNAGLQRGGEEGSGTRSSLLWECEKAIQAKHPKYMFMENVKALVSRKFMPVFGKWCERVEGYGYRVFWQVLNSKDYGVPQNRERVFAVFIREDVCDERYVFPKGFPLETRLKDVLEDGVDEKFYLSESAVEGFLVNKNGKNEDTQTEGIEGGEW